MSMSAANSARGRDLTQGGIAKNLVFFAIPMLLGSLVHVAYSLINAAWVGRGLGADAMAALTVSFPVFFVLNAVGQGLSLASNVLVSQAFGAKDFDRLRRVVQNSMVLTAVAGAVCLFIGYLSAGALVRVMGTPATVAPLAISYLRWFIWTTPLMFGTFFLASVMRGAGDSKTPLYFQAGSLLITAVLDPLLIFGWLGFPKLGLNGTALATIISQAAAITALAWHLRRVRHIAAPDWKRVQPDWAMSLLTLRIGMPSMVQQALVSLGIVVVVSLVNRFGAHSAAAYGIAMRIDLLAFMPSMAIGMAVSTMSGQNIGAGLHDRVRGVFRWGVLLAWMLTLPAAAMSVGVPAWLMGLFTRDMDVVATGAGYLRVCGGGYLLISIMFVANGVVNGSGRTVATTVFTLVSFWLIRIPLALALSGAMNQVEGIWFAILLSYGVGAALSTGYYLTGRWRHPVTGRNQLQPVPEPGPVDPQVEV